MIVSKNTLATTAKTAVYMLIGFCGLVAATFILGGVAWLVQIAG